MFRPFAIALAISTILGTGLPGRANSITYDFTGRFDRPMNGTTQFSGSFSINSDPTRANIGYVISTQSLFSEGVAQPIAYIFSPSLPNPYQVGPVAEFGKDVSMTINMGGQVIHYVNTPQNPFAATLTTSPFSNMDSSGKNFGPPMAYFRIDGVTANYAPGNSFSNNSFSLAFIDPNETAFRDLAPGQAANLGNFNFSMTSFHGISAGGPSGGSYNGTITSIESVTTPEPSTLLLVAQGGLLYYWRLRTRRRGSAARLQAVSREV